MSSRQPFCAICGDTQNVLQDGLCPNCYQKEHPLVIERDTPMVSFCRRCYSYKVEHKWITVDSQKQSLEEILTRAAYLAVQRSYEIAPNIDIDLRLDIPSDIDAQLKLNRDFLIEGELIIEGQPNPDLPEIDSTKSIQVKIHPTICPRCLGIHRGSFEALLQIRGGRRRLTADYIESILALIADKIEQFPRVYIPKIKEVRGGVDIQLSDKRIAHQLANMLSKRMQATQKASSKVTGIKDGVPVTRLVLALTFPPIWVGDYVHTEKGLFLITKLTSDGAFGIHQQSDKRTFLNRLENYYPLDITTRVKAWLLVSKARETAQLMHLETYEMHEIPLFIRLNPFSEGTEISGLFLDEEFYIIDEPQST